MIVNYTHGLFLLAVIEIRANVNKIHLNKRTPTLFVNSQVTINKQREKEIIYNGENYNRRRNNGRALPSDWVRKKKTWAHCICLPISAPSSRANAAEKYQIEPTFCYNQLATAEKLS